MFDFRQRDAGQNFSQNLMFEIRAKPGDGIGVLAISFDESETSPFTLVEILGEDRARIRVANKSLGWEQSRKTHNDAETGDTAVLKLGNKLTAWTHSCDGGSSYTLRISDLDQVPSVTADSPKLVEAIKAFANVTIDDRGSIQGVGPPGLLGQSLPRHSHEKPKRPNGFTEDDLRNIAKLKNLRELHVGGGSITDTSLVHLKNLNRLVLLSLASSNVSDVGLCNLEGLSRMETLDLSGTEVGNDGLSHLECLSHLETLRLFGTKVGNEGLRHLARLKRLEWLDLARTKVDDDAVPTLAELKSLERLDLTGTGITSVGYWELCQAIPRCCNAAQHSTYWGWVEKLGKTFGPEKYASETGVRERTIFRLVLLRCFLREDSDGRIVGARVDLTLPLARVGSGDPFKQTREILDLLGKLGSIESLRVENSLPKRILQ